MMGPVHGAGPGQADRIAEVGERWLEQAEQRCGTPRGWPWKPRASITAHSAAVAATSSMLSSVTESKPRRANFVPLTAPPHRAAATTRARSWRAAGTA